MDPRAQTKYTLINGVKSYNVWLPKTYTHAIKKCGVKIRNNTIPLNRSTGIYKNAPRFSSVFCVG